MRHERKLARAVIAQAWADAEHPTSCSPNEYWQLRNDARLWLRGGSELEFWCVLADIASHWVTKAARVKWPEAA
jgi:hypothetical protein